MDLIQALLREMDWLRQQLEIKDKQLALLWRENHLLRRRCESLELSRRYYDASTHRVPGLAPSGQRGIDGGVGQDSSSGGTEVVYIQPGEVPTHRVLPVGPPPARSPVPRGGDAPVLEMCALSNESLGWPRVVPRPIRLGAGFVVR
jgi:hypothetical protein